MLKGIYLAACKARHKNYDLDYNDIDNKYNCNIIGDMLSVDLTKYDYIIATPPCNYYSRANYRRDKSEYSLSTMHLLPTILEKLSQLNKPFIVENVRNSILFEKQGIYDIARKYNLHVQIVGRHTYFTNTFINLECEQQLDFHNKNTRKKLGLKFMEDSYRQGGINVYNVIEIWLNYINNNIHKNKKLCYEQLCLF